MGSVGSVGSILGNNRLVMTINQRLNRYLVEVDQAQKKIKKTVDNVNRLC